jgi:farnesyl-diphosphate farnesyltransferase
MSKPPVDDRAYLELLEQTPAVLAELFALPSPACAAIVRHASRTIDGMAMVVARADEGGNLRLGSTDDLEDYCYLVAGIVGELLTDLFVGDTASLATELPTLSRTMAAFGEGLQLVNILKDAKDDEHHGRVYRPPTATRDEILGLARRDLELGNEYLAALVRGNAPRGVIGFAALLLTLARASLDRTEAHGPGAKIPRHEVVRLHAALERELARDGAPGRFASRA